MKTYFFVILTSLAFCSGFTDAAERSPNIIFFLFDDFGWSQPSSYNADTRLNLPNFDKLAAEGMRFTECALRGSGLHPDPLRSHYGSISIAGIGQFGVLGTWSPPIIPTERMTVASLLKQQGYETACVGKWHLGMEWADGEGKGQPPIGSKILKGPNQLGFDYFCGFTHAGNIGTIIEQDQVIAHVDKVENQPLMLRKAKEWIGNRDPSEPFFLYFPVCPPHYPVAPAPEFIGKSGGEDVAGKDLTGRMIPKTIRTGCIKGISCWGKSSSR